ncbi:hypothetical protein GN958_ATG12014, partial [Phytophthora infestans]
MRRSSKRDLDILNWMKQKRSLTPHVKGLSENERARIGEYQLKISCRHINAVLNYCGLQEHSINAFHPSYLVATNAHAFSGRGLNYLFATPTLLASLYFHHLFTSKPGVVLPDILR